MTYNTALQNLNRVLRRTVQSAATVDGTTQTFVTIPFWPLTSQVARIKVKSTSSLNGCKIALLGDGAAFRASGDAPYYDATSSDTATQFTFDLSGAYFQDDTGMGYLCLLVASNAAFPAGTVLTVTAEGNATIPGDNRVADSTGVSYDPTWRVLYVNANNVGVIDLSKMAIGNGNPYRPKEFLGLYGEGDTLWIGSTSPFYGMEITIADDGGAATGDQIFIASMTRDGAISNSVETNLTGLQDNTSDGMDSLSALRYSGTVRWGIESGTVGQNWEPFSPEIDPMRQMIDQALAATTPYAWETPVLPNYPAHYWIRIRAVNAPARPIILTGVRPLPLKNGEMIVVND